MPETDGGGGPVGLVLAGGGARGAYEIGALAELLPALAEPDLPRILVGTSVGALNCAHLAATANEPVVDRVRRAAAFWADLSWRQVLRPLVSGAELRRAVAYVRELGGCRAQPVSLLDTAPLAKTVAEQISFPQVHANVGNGDVGLDAVAVVCTSGVTSLSVVFHDGGRSPDPDAVRGIEYVDTVLSGEHVLGSAAVPGIFPAAKVGTDPGRGWYFDGGTRLNTPIKPALRLGAERVIVIALNSLPPRRDRVTDRRPGALDGAAQLIQGLLVDPLVNDIQTLAGTNELILDGDLRGERRLVPYILIAPQDPDEIGQLAAELYASHYARWRDSLCSDVARVGRLLDAGASPTHGELFSYVFFASELARELLQRGARDARAWLAGQHDDGVWQHRRL
jgi:NTE family protein